MTWAARIRFRRHERDVCRAMARWLPVVALIQWWTDGLLRGLTVFAVGAVVIFGWFLVRWRAWEELDAWGGRI